MRMGALPLRAQPPLGVFDAHHPPDEGLLKVCVHCGFCLPTCPTYRLWGQEMDAPRGRIYLMQLGLKGEISLDGIVAGHFDACLGCAACVTACPSGVRYDRLIGATRSQLERNWKRRRGERLMRGMMLRLFPYPQRLRVAAVAAWAYQRLRLGRLLRRVGLFRRLPAELQALEELVPVVCLKDLHRRIPERTPAAGTAVMRVGMVTGCVQSVFFAGVNRATVRVLAAEGCEVIAPRAQGCCGALMHHAGDEAAALEKARRMITAFEGTAVERIVVNAAGCGSTLKEYGYLLRDDPEWAPRAAAFSAKVRDITEFLEELPVHVTRHPIAATAVYLDACHLAHAQGIRAQPRRQLRAIPGLAVAEVGDAEICCGSAGIYNLVRTEAAAELGRRKVAEILRASPDLIVTGNPGCALQIRRHLATSDNRIPILHPVELIDASIRGAEPFPPL
ncbi:MAG: heterodisulfide reductase-related iron-sulfur binding cluster [Actinomycetota bacterium]